METGSRAALENYNLEDFRLPQHCPSSNPTLLSLRPNGETYLPVRDSNPSQQPHQHRSCVRIAVVCAIACIVIIVTVDAGTTRQLEAHFSRFVDWVALHPFGGIVAVILVYVVATICFVPGSVLTIGTGYAFGQAFAGRIYLAVVFATSGVFLGASLGSLVCLLLGRYLFREPVLHLAEQYPIFQAIDRALERNGFKIMLLLRLSPLIPYNALDYISGVTSISIRHYCMAFVGLLPGAVTLSYIGATASSIADGTNAVRDLRTIILLFGIVFAIAGGAVASYYSKVELDKILEEQRQADDASSQGGLFPLTTSYFEGNEPPVSEEAGDAYQGSL